MSDKPVELYSDENHRCLLFGGLVEGAGIQSNQFLIIDNGHKALLDPGGELTFVPLSIAISQQIELKELDFVLASHQDPDIISSLDKWLSRTNCKVVISKLWARFLPHLSSGYADTMRGSNVFDRVLPVPDEGMVLRLGETGLKILPAHFLHSVGNHQVYDPVSKILFSGDMGASIVEADAAVPVGDFDAHIPAMVGFHKRYMVSGKICRLWANMIRDLDVEMIIPQHGRYFSGKDSVNAFLDWISTLECGIDLMNQSNYMPPH